MSTPTTNFKKTIYLDIISLSGSLFTQAILFLEEPNFEELKREIYAYFRPKYQTYIQKNFDRQQCKLIFRFSTISILNQPTITKEDQFNNYLQQEQFPRFQFQFPHILLEEAFKYCQDNTIICHSQYYFLPEEDQFFEYDGFNSNYEEQSDGFSTEQQDEYFQQGSILENIDYNLEHQNEYLPYITSDTSFHFSIRRRSQMQKESIIDLNVEQQIIIQNNIKPPVDQKLIQKMKSKSRKNIKIKQIDQFFIKNSVKKFSKKNK